MKPGKSAVRVAIVGAIAVALASPAPPGRVAWADPPGKPSAAAKKKKGKKHAPTHGKHGKHVTVAKKPPPPPPPPLDGTSYDYGYDGRADGHRERAWLGRVFVHRKAAEATGSRCRSWCSSTATTARASSTAGWVEARRATSGASCPS